MKVKGGRVYVHGFQALCAAGEGLGALAAAAAAGEGFRPASSKDLGPPGEDYPVARVEADLPRPAGLPSDFDSRNNALAWAAVRQLLPLVERAAARHGAGRVAVVVGSTTSGMAEAEQAFRRMAEGRGGEGGYRYAQQELGSPAQFLAWALGVAGPVSTVSTACSSSAKAFAAARRLLRLGVCDAVVCGGVDTLCGFTVRGFAALGALARERCNPFSRERRGINIGEAAAFCLVDREEGPVFLAGCGESSDAYNMSAPLPRGEGAESAMRAALRDADLGPDGVGYLNLHGTGTLHNDAMEARAVARVFPGGVPCSSTKPVTGHTLGAAGALEAALCWDLLREPSGARALPPHLFDGALDPDLPRLALVGRGGPVPAVDRVMSNSFGFGGSNVSLIFGRT